jgi:hypothetical protein
MEDKKVRLTSCFPYLETYFSLRFPVFFVCIIFYLLKDFFLCFPFLGDIRGDFADLLRGREFTDIKCDVT